MSTCPVIANVHCLEIEGTGARGFAQAQFSGDVDALAPGHWQWNAWLTPQGRVRALMHLADPGDGRLLAILRGGDPESIRADLARYLLRVPATVALRTFTGSDAGPLDEGEVRLDGDAVVLGYGDRSLRLAAAEAPDPAARLDWRREDIARGWPSLPAGEPEFLPPALGLEHLGAVAFDKGCFPGQEIAARLHYRGGHKYRLQHLRGAAPLPADPVGQPGSVRLRTLDEVSEPGRMDALVVAPQDIPSEINVLDNIYRVISIFDA